MTLPMGATKVVREAWDRIDDTVTFALEDYGSTYINSHTALPVDPDDGMYGCGVWGCVYPTRDPRWVVKVSSDPLEGPVVKAVMDDKYLRNHPGNAYIGGIWTLAEQVRWGRSGWRSVWVILREAVQPVEYRGMYGTAHRRGIKLLNLIRTAGTFMNRHHDKDAAKYARARKQWERLMVEALENRKTRVVADFMRVFEQKFDAVLGDVHGGNVGLRRHKFSDIAPLHGPAKYWVAFDLGHSSVYPEDADIPLVKNPGIEVI